VRVVNDPAIEVVYVEASRVPVKYEYMTSVEVRAEIHLAIANQYLGRAY
jgi:hypothetical protein